MRSLRVFFCAAVVFASTAANAGAQFANSSTEGSIEGRAAARAFVEYTSPKMCAVALERPQCFADFQRLRFALSPTQLSTVDRWLTDGNVRHRLTAYQPYIPPDTLWATDATFAWWLHASALAMLDGATGAQIENYRATLARILETQKGSAPSGLSAPIAISVVANLAPIGPLPEISARSATDRPSGSMQTGVYSETLAELLDSPNAIALPDGRAFALDVVDLEEAFDRSYGDHYSFASIRAVLAGKIPNDPATIDAELRRPLARWQRILHTDRVRSDSFLFGVVAARIAYDGSVSHNSFDDRTLRTFARQLRSAHVPSARVRSSARALLKLPLGKSDWRSISIAAGALVRAIAAADEHTDTTISPAFTTPPAVLPTVASPTATSIAPTLPAAVPSANAVPTTVHLR